ncbi:unnamed protein product [Fraxinus pennsylvanica]|uniref:Protein kinase domain-containing protein n=1 Tax=Fraxinus pennsylvanica TaxID=56036 RepID=A0AAD1ZE17_9LAMI|nr:unnamed protein product [Fraxinus pennsylvanica]
MAWSPTDIIESKLVFFREDGSGEYGLEELLGSSAELLGKGTFGTSYKVPKYAVVVKRLKIVGCLAEMEFIEKVKELGSQFLHQYLLPLKAFCCHQNERLLLYDHMQMGSLAFVLHGNGGAHKTPLTWEVRCRIAYRVASAIQYLHSQYVFHGNVRSSNIFLTSSFDAYLSEYAIAQLFSDTKPIPNLVIGYCAPEVTNARQISQKSDVYSFGVLLFELLTGKAPTNALNVKEKGTDLPNWVRSMFQEKPLIDVFDNALHGYYNTSGIGEKMVQLLQLSLCCTFQYPNKRPSMAAVTNQIRETCSFER